MMSEKKFKVGDRVRFKKFCINCDEDVRVAEGDYGTVVSVGDPRIKNSNDIGVELDVPQYISVYSKDVERVEPTDPRSAFLQELKELFAKYNVEVDGGCFGHDGDYPFVRFYSKEFNLIYCDEYDSKFEFPLTPDNIMDYE